jgi:predicted DNA-binding protein
MEKTKSRYGTPLKDNILEKETPIILKSKAFITKSFRLPVEMASKLKEYSENIAPKHLLITESDIIRYMIENFDLEEARKNFFKIKE